MGRTISSPGLKLPWHVLSIPDGPTVVLNNRNETVAEVIEAGNCLKCGELMIVEIGDDDPGFECPFCENYYVIARRVEEAKPAEPDEKQGEN